MGREPVAQFPHHFEKWKMSSYQHSPPPSLPSNSTREDPNPALDDWPQMHNEKTCTLDENRGRCGERLGTAGLLWEKMVRAGEEEHFNDE